MRYITSCPRTATKHDTFLHIHNDTTSITKTIPSYNNDITNVQQLLDNNKDNNIFHTISHVKDPNNDIINDQQLVDNNNKLYISNTISPIKNAYHSNSNTPDDQNHDDKRFAPFLLLVQMIKMRTVFFIDSDDNDSITSSHNNTDDNNNTNYTNNVDVITWI